MDYISYSSGSVVIRKKNPNPQNQKQIWMTQRKNLCWFFLCINSSSEVYLRQAYEISFTLLRGMPPTPVALHPNSLPSLHRASLGCSLNTRPDNCLTLCLWHCLTSQIAFDIYTINEHPGPRPETRTVPTHVSGGGWKTSHFRYP